MRQFLAHGVQQWSASLQFLSWPGRSSKNHAVSSSQSPSDLAECGHVALKFCIKLRQKPKDHSGVKQMRREGRQKTRGQNAAEWLGSSLAFTFQAVMSQCVLNTKSEHSSRSASIYLPYRPWVPSQGEEQDLCLCTAFVRALAESSAGAQCWVSDGSWLPAWGEQHCSDSLARHRGKDLAFVLVRSPETFALVS